MLPHKTTAKQPLNPASAFLSKIEADSGDNDNDDSWFYLNYY